ncbi:MAG: HET-C-related protein [Pricia sp.]
MDLTEIHTELTSYVNEQEQIDMERSPDIDHFGAGRVNQKEHQGSVGHQDILDEIINVKEGYFSSEEGLKIYYGNWLRDFSQVIVGSTIRLSAAAQAELKKQHPKNRYIQTLLEAMPSKLDVDGMVRLVHIAAIKEFEYKVQEKLLRKEGTFDYNFKQNEINFNKRFGKLTPEILGAYRPEEHIDNPKKLMDESMLYDWQYGNRTVTLYRGRYDSDGNFLGGGRDPHLDIDLEHGLKDYIINDRGHGYQSARSYMLGQLKEAMAAGRTTKGLRHFGAALHVLEDYFAHTNFTEVSLIKVGHVQVHPWVKFVYQTGFDAEAVHRAADLKKGAKAVVQGNCYASGGSFYSLAKHIPIVTGLFGLDDTAASVLPKLADILFEIDFEAYRKPKPGERTIGQVAIREVLENLAKGQEADGAKENSAYMGNSYAQWLTYYDQYLVYLDFKAKTIQEGGIGGTLWEWHDRFFKAVGDQLTWFTNFAFNILLQGINEETADEQTLHSNKNYGTDPTHTQIAKDPPEHHFNPLAGELAKYAVKAVATEIIKYWNNVREAQKQHVLDTAADFMVHPVKCTWQDKIVADWAEKNMKKVERGHDATTVAHHHGKVTRELEGFNEIYKDINEYFSNR